MTNLSMTTVLTDVITICHMCGERRHFGGFDISERVGEWARHHIRPDVLTVRTSLDGVDRGWS
jgi:hypothetical protein